jgi:hypothetical protein
MLEAEQHQLKSYETTWTRFWYKNWNWDAVERIFQFSPVKT